MKQTLSEIKSKILPLGMAGIIVAVGNQLPQKKAETETPSTTIPQQFSHVERYYEELEQFGKTTKYYATPYVWLLYDKDTYDVSEYLFYSQKTLFGFGLEVELYNLESEELLVCGDGITRRDNEDYFRYLVNNNYEVCLADMDNYLDGVYIKDYYTLDEIKKIEPIIKEGLKNINSAKVKVKVK